MELPYLSETSGNCLWRHERRKNGRDWTQPLRPSPILTAHAWSRHPRGVDRRPSTPGCPNTAKTRSA